MMLVVFLSLNHNEQEMSMMMCLSRVNVYHGVSAPTIIFAESGFVTRVRLSAWRPLTNERLALGPRDQ